jgi:NTP pyrophosphatase (non-canonical NTP hydrolase)
MTLVPSPANPSNDYIDKALRTESGKFHPIQKRLFTEIVDNCADALSELDWLKKAIFYGKDLDTARGNPALLLDPHRARVLHGVVGIATEAGELLEALRDHVEHGKPLDPVNLREELGDLMWYMAILCRALGTDFETEQKRNIAKLTARYPEKFTETRAIDRDLEQERQVLSA